MRWFLTGAALGALGAVYGLFRLRQTRRVALEPGELVDAVGAVMNTLGHTARDAWDESREAISEAEGELRAAYVERRPHLRDASI